MKAPKVSLVGAMLSCVAIALLLLSTGYTTYRTIILQSPGDNCLTGVPSAEVVEDAWLAEVRPEVGWGNCENVPGATYKLFIGNLAYVPPGAAGNEYRTVIKFLDITGGVVDYPIPANAIIDRAMLTIKQTWCQAPYADGSVPAGCSGARLTISAHQVRTHWEEKYARWMDMPVFDAVPLSTRAVSNVRGVKLNLDITKAFREWWSGASPNEGVILIMNPLPNNDFFRGRSHDTVCDPVQGCSGGQGDPPGKGGPKITVTWHYSTTGAR